MTTVCMYMDIILELEMGTFSYSKNYVITANNNALTCITLDKDLREECYTFDLSSYVFLALDIFFI